MNDSNSEDKLLKCIIVPMSLKEEEREAMQAMSFNLDMPMIPFEEVYTIQHITHRFNPDGNMPILTLISNSGRVLLADGITDLQDSMD